MPEGGDGGEGACMGDVCGGAGLSRLFERNPAYRDICLDILAYCDDERSEFDVIERCENLRSSRSQIQSAPAIVDMLVEGGGIDQTILVDGAVYPGTFEDLRADETVAEDARVSVRLRTSPAGRAARASVLDGLTLDRLILDHPEREAAFRLVLSLCSDGPGKTTREIQEALHERDLLERDAGNGVEGLHASYFTGALERIGVLVWNGQRWMTCDPVLAGR